MPIYHLKLIPKPKDPTHDILLGVVVIAGSYTKARELAAGVRGDEGSARWTDPKGSSCHRIGDTTEETASVVCTDFRHG